MINRGFVKELLYFLGHRNIDVATSTTFNWDGCKVTDDTRCPICRASTVNLSEEFCLKDFLAANSNKFIVFIQYPDGKLVNDDNQIRIFIS